jgi:hypothetical protein
VETESVPESDRTDGSFAPGVSVRPLILWRTKRITISALVAADPVVRSMLLPHPYW